MTIRKSSQYTKIFRLFVMRTMTHLTAQSISQNRCGDNTGVLAEPRDSEGGIYSGEKSYKWF